MPETIGNHGLYCPDFDDYAAVALFMQDLGTKIDENLGAQRDALNDFLNAPTIILTNSVAKTIPVSTSISNVFDTVVFSNSTFMTYNFFTNVLHLGTAIGVLPVVPYRKGAYSSGGGCRMTATGAVTVGSSRRFAIFVTDAESPSIGLGDLAIQRDITSDRNTGGNEGLNVARNFVATGTTGIEITHEAVSGNAASTTTIPAGSAFLWVTYNGATEIVEVA